MRQSGRRFTLLAGLALAGSLIVGCGGSDEDSGGGEGLEKTTLTVASLPLVDGAALHVGIKNGLFEQEGLKIKVEAIAQSTLALPALKDGKVDIIAGANYVSFLAANEQKAINLSVLNEAATLSKGMMGVLAPSDSKIRTPKDLEGKKIAINLPHNIQELTFNAILQANNVDPKKVKYVPIPFPQMGGALQKEQVDAIHVGEPFLSSYQKELGARVVANGGDEPVTQMPISAYVTTQEWTQKNPKSAAAFQRAMLKAQAMAASDRKKVEEVLPGYARIEPGLASVISLPDYPTSNNKTRLQRVVDLMVSQQALKTKPDLNAIVFEPKPA
jgi:NitT/TauT family transport system substrate-binding protein